MRTSEEVEAEVEASRDELDRNVEALKQKMSPGQLFDEAAHLMGGTGQQVASKFAEQAKANPMPLAVMGLGLAWLMMSNNRNQMSATFEPRSFSKPHDPQAGYNQGDEDAEKMAEGLKDKARHLGEKAHDMASSVQDKVTGARDTVAEAGRSAGHKAQQTFLDTLHGEPLLIAGAGLLVGLAVGSALPATEAEDRMLGETRDKLVEKGKALAQETMEKAGAAAQATYGAVKSELQDGDAQREPADRLADAARSGVQAAKDQLQTPPN